jgi:3-(3-hydroxy-phenyl)propionate hydroxylase
MAFKFPPQRMFWFAPTFDKSNISLMHQQPDSIWRIDWQLGPDDDPEIECTPERVNQRLATMFGPDVPFETQFASIYAFEVRRIAKFRHDRVFFAGDAAHQLSPFGGGRGGNSAIQDVDNLVWKLAHVLRGAAPQSLLDSYDAERAPVADENMRLSRRAAEFINPSSAHSLALRNAVLALAPYHAFAKVMINTGRLSVAPDLSGSPLLTPDDDSWDTPIAPGFPAVDAPLGADDWLIHHLTGGFVLMFYMDRSQAIAPETVVALAALARESVPVRAVAALAKPGAAIAGVDTIHDDRSLVRKRYDLKPESSYLFRPDQHVVARWRSLNADAVRAAVLRSLGHTSR